MATAIRMAGTGLAAARWPAFLLEPRGDRRWDAFLRGTGAAALLGIPIILLFPSSVTLVWLAVLSLLTNSPLSPVLPTAFEPIIMEAAKWQSVWAVTAVATAGYMYMEYVNWHVYGWVLGWNRMSGLSERRSVRWAIGRFAHFPFATVVIFAFTPLPFWVSRILAVLHRYPLWKFMAATCAGRMPRILIYAWVGELLRVPSWLLVAAILVPPALIVGYRLLRGEPPLREISMAAQDDQAVPEPSLIEDREGARPRPRFPPPATQGAATPLSPAAEE